MTYLAIAASTFVAAIFIYKFYQGCRARGQGLNTDAQVNATGHANTSTVSIAISDEGDNESYAGDEKNALSKVPSVTTVSLTKAEDMPPPPIPRPASAPNIPALAVKRQSMPPPSSLPPSRSRSPPRLKPPAVSRPPTLNGMLRPPPSLASSLRVPPQRVLQNTHMQPASSTLPLPNQSNAKKSKKIVLQPGHSPLDWAALQRSTTPDALSRLRGKDASLTLTRVSSSRLKKQNGRHGRDAWTVYQGRVYNITAYLDFHPGGRDELMKGAGRRSDELFAEVHPWVNWEGMLAECCLGILVADDVSEQETNTLDEMD